MRKVLSNSYGIKILPYGCENEEDVIRLFDRLKETKIEDFDYDKLIYTNPIKINQSIIFISENMQKKDWRVLRITKIDTSKKWLISNHDGYEFVEYYEIGENNELLKLQEK